MHEGSGDLLTTFQPIQTDRQSQARDERAPPPPDTTPPEHLRLTSCREIMLERGCESGGDFGDSGWSFNPAAAVQTFTAETQVEAGEGATRSGVQQLLPLHHLHSQTPCIPPP